MLLTSGSHYLIQAFMFSIGLLVTVHVCLRWLGVAELDANISSKLASGMIFRNNLGNLGVNKL